ncbi:MAG: hypothetical protein IKJ91_12690 [Clostridia bacterium]|nr:hypothetical protein [Clostridia bacterium]
MKKLVSLLVLTALVLSSMAVCVSANGSPKGEITKAVEANPTVVDADGNAVTDIDTTGGALTKLTHHEEEAHYVPDEDQFHEHFGHTYDDYKFYGSFDLRLTEHGKKVVGNGKLTGIELTINIPGMTAANNPTVFYFDVEHDIYHIIKNIRVEGSTITFMAMPLTAANDEAALASLDALTVTTLLTANETVQVSDTDIGHYGVIYTGAITSPATGVPTAAFVIVLVVALAGAAFAGKKIFAK